MLTLDITHGGVSPNALTSVCADLDDYRTYLADVVKRADTTVAEASIALPELRLSVSIETAVSNYCDQEKLRYIVVVGIGGSNLGAMAVYDAVVGRYDTLRARAPKMLFLDTVSATALHAVESALLRCATVDEFIVFVISKSGATTETVANTEALHASLAARFTSVRTRFVAITDNGSTLWQRTHELGMPALEIPTMVGGRYCVFSAAGLAPLALAGINMHALLDGARGAVRDCTTQGATNPALVSAAHTYLHARSGIRMHNTFLFDPDLESVGKWYRQLMGESIGKSLDVGVTPLVSIGSTDLHSMAQLYLGGPKDKLTNIVTRPDEDATVPPTLLMHGLVDHIEKQSFNTIMSAIVGGVTSAYRDAGLPFLTMHLRDRSVGAIGYYLQMRMIEMMYLAKLFDVNAFNQPAVELYKKETRTLLAR